MNEQKLSATFVFTETGTLKGILFQVGNEKDQATLEHALNQLFKPDHLGWVKRLFKR